MTMSWHQKAAVRRAIDTANVPAHIVDEKRYGFFALCGARVPQVTVPGEVAHEERNAPVCAKCLKAYSGGNKK